MHIAIVQDRWDWHLANGTAIPARLAEDVHFQLCNESEFVESA